jgi:flagellar hook assembly protein FlgD
MGINDHGSISAVNTYPNPFSNATTITYTLNAYARDFSVSIYNIMGQEVTRLYSGVQTAGTHSISWEGTNAVGESLESGVYFFTLNDGSGQLTKKLKLTR